MDSLREKICLMSQSFNLLLLMLFFCQVFRSETREFDPKGYVVYCPCMGRFGNQADHFLGALSFAHGLDRTLILPPWIEYPPALRRNSIQIPFDKYFKVDPLREYHRVITMETFMDEFAATVWPAGKRVGFCFKYRSDGDCKMKEGNPPGPFWNNFKIDFDSYLEYNPLSLDTHAPHIRKAWEERFPVSEYPVIAFSGAPAVFPVTKENRELHQFLHWSEEIEKEADQFIEQNLSMGPFVGVHMRQGSDWMKACELVGRGKHFFSSPQCLGYQNEFGELSQDMCKPSPDLVQEQIKAIVKKIQAKGVFIASDVEPDIKSLKKVLPAEVKLIQRKPSEPHVDLAILAKSDHYICNCLSSFSSFAKRERDVTGKPTSFWGFGEDYEIFKQKGKTKKPADEL